MIKDNIYLTQPIPDGYSWSIVSRLGHILNEIEKNYGKRDPIFTILGIELTKKTIPQIWFPNNCGHIIIQITDNCIKDMAEAVFQVAHEAVHCLNPVLFGQATVLEEGLATYFAINYTNEHFPEKNTKPSDHRYQTAESMVRKLLDGRPKIIRHLRSIEPSLSKITKDLLLEIHPELAPELAGQVTQSFANL